MVVASGGGGFLEHADFWGEWAKTRRRRELHLELLYPFIIFRYEWALLPSYVGLKQF